MGVRSDSDVVGRDPCGGPAPVDLSVCVACGDWFDQPHVAEDAAVLICRACGHRQPFRRLPLVALTGPSGAGKSTVGRLLVRALADVAVVLEQDVLWTAGLRDPCDDFGQFRVAWLRMAAMIHQSGRPVVLVGTVVPAQLEQRAERVFIGPIHYLGLVCRSDVLRARLVNRPAWRGWTPSRIAETLAFNDWLQHAASSLDPPVELIDTTDQPVTETAAAVAAWVRQRIAAAD